MAMDSSSSALSQPWYTPISPAASADARNATAHSPFTAATSVRCGSGTRQLTRSTHCALTSPAQASVRACGGGAALTSHTLGAETAATGFDS